MSKNGRVYKVPEVPAVRSVVVELPVSDEPYAEYSRRVLYPNIHIRGLTREMQAALRNLFNGCVNAHCTFRTGKPVTSQADAVKWLLENNVFQGDE